MRIVRGVLALLVLVVSPVTLAAPCAGFVDVDDTSPFCVNVEWMKNRGITLGLTPTQYDPNSPVTRLQMAAFMYRLGFQNAFLQGGNAFGTITRVGTADDNVLEIIANNQIALRIAPNAVSPRIVAGHSGNFALAAAIGATVSGGGKGSPSAECVLTRGCANAVVDRFGTVGGGVGNLAGMDGNDATDGEYATVGGGLSNRAGKLATVGGGQINLASGQHATVPGGFGNQATGLSSFAAGQGSKAQGMRTVAIGYHAIAPNDGCIVFGDNSTTSDVFCIGANEFVARSLGGFYLLTGGTNMSNHTGAMLTPGSTAWAVFSDRDGKEEIVAVDPDDVLRKVAAMPLSTWQWKTEPGSVRHMGPMAQDFHAAFGLGTSDKQIATVDTDGVALAAIQGLNAKIENRLTAKDAEIAALRAELADIRALLGRRVSVSTVATRLSVGVRRRLVRRRRAGHVGAQRVHLLTARQHRPRIARSVLRAP